MQQAILRTNLGAGNAADTEMFVDTQVDYLENQRGRK